MCPARSFPLRLAAAVLGISTVFAGSGGGIFSLSSHPGRECLEPPFRSGHCGAPEVAW